MKTIDIRTEPEPIIWYIKFAEPERNGEYFCNRIDVRSVDGAFYIDEADGQGDTLRVHKDDIDNLILALKRAKELLK